MSSRLSRKIRTKLPVDKELFLSMLGGLESGVATTTAIILGLLISGGSNEFIITAAYITLSVQAFNSASARYVALRTSLEIEDQTSKERRFPLVNASIQFAFHVVASSLPILPLFILDDKLHIAIASISLSLLTLTLTGILQGRFLFVQAKQNMQEILVIGLLVMTVGTIAGLLLSR
jgi:vacuolar iron transporter family protein